MTTMAIFETNLSSGSAPSITIWLIQRASDSCPLLEALCNKDLNHDSDLKDSNNLIGTTPGQPGYFPRGQSQSSMFTTRILRTDSPHPSHKTRPR